MRHLLLLFVPGEFEEEYEEEYDPKDDVYVPKKKRSWTSLQSSYAAEAGYEIVPSQRRGNVLLAAGAFKYNLNRTTNGIKYYTCMHKRFPLRCKGSGKLDIATDVFYSNGNHTCDQPLPEDAGL